MRRTVALALALAVAGTVVAFAIPAAAQDSSGSDESILRIGWAQDPQTLNPFVGLDEEDYNVWAMNWDLLVNFDPEDLSPAPGSRRAGPSLTTRRRSPSSSIRRRSGRTASRSPPTDVKWSLETLGDEGDLFTNYTSNVTRIDTPDDYTVVVHTSKPDARIIGGLFIYILPEHIWGKVPLKDLTGQYKPELPLVGSGPYIVTEYEHGRIIRMERNPNFRGPEPAFDQVQYIKYGTQDAVERALQLGEIDMVVEVQADELRAARRRAQHRDGEEPDPRVHRARVQPVPARQVPGRRIQPRGPGPRRAPGDRVRDRPRADQHHRGPRDLVSSPRDPARVLQVVLRAARRRTIHSTSTAPTRSSTTPAG